MSITLLTGLPGNGKSFSAMRKLLLGLERGQFVATNIEPGPGWALTFARSNVFTRMRGKRFVAARAVDFERRLYVVEDLADLMRLRIPACGRCGRCKSGEGVCQKEGRGLAVLDEAHIWMNSRTWDQDERGEGLSRSEAVSRRLRITRFFAQHRKRGWDVILIAQQAGLLDNQVRGLYEYHSVVRNIRKLPVWWNPLRFMPWVIFVAVTSWNDPTKTKCGVECYFLSKSVANLYDTMAVSGGMDDDENAIMLGRHQDEIRADFEAIASGLGAARSEDAGGVGPPPGSLSSAVVVGGRQEPGEASWDANDGLDPRIGPSPFKAGQLPPGGAAK